MDKSTPLNASCRCGAVLFEATGAPIVHAACYCADCREGGRRIEQLPNAPPVVSADGGVDYMLYRKDRIRCVQGGEHLRAYRLKPDSPTRRLVAACCNSAMAVDFTRGHWLTVYSARLPEPLPPLEMRVMTAQRPEGVVLADDAPSYPRHAGRFMGKLLGAWAAMGFRRPRVKGLPA